jgi:GNAT superfamily N-acetyltransferase
MSNQPPGAAAERGSGGSRRARIGSGLRPQDGSRRARIGSGLRPQDGSRLRAFGGGRRARAGSGRVVLLRDGSRVLCRPVRRSDAPLLADLFSRLSERSRRQRFLVPRDRLTDAELRYLTDIDHRDHEAELAVTVADAWQGRGLGTELVRQLGERARQEGIGRFTAFVTAGNLAVAGLLRAMSASLIGRDAAILEYEISLIPDPAHDYGFGELMLGRI